MTQLFKKTVDDGEEGGRKGTIGRRFLPRVVITYGPHMNLSCPDCRGVGSSLGRGKTRFSHYSSWGGGRTEFVADDCGLTLYLQRLGVDITFLVNFM